MSIVSGMLLVDGYTLVYDAVRLDVSIDDTVTETLPAGRHFYDVKLERVADGFVRRIAKGRAQVSGEVTR